MATNEEKNARLKLKDIYTKLGWNTWDVNPSAQSPYQIGINLNGNSKYQSQLGIIEDIVHGVAQESKLKMIMTLPALSLGGDSVYVGISHINPELLKRFENYKKLKNYSGNLGSRLEKGFELLEKEQAPIGIGVMLEKVMKKTF